jgi:hypothetical protein
MAVIMRRRLCMRPVLQELAHAGIDDGKAGRAGGPALEGGVRAGPGEAAPVGIEFFIKDVRVKPQDGEVELPPGEFFDVGESRLQPVPLSRSAAYSSRMPSKAEAQVLAEQ